MSMSEDLNLVKELTGERERIERNRLNSISPNDGKYAEKCDPLRKYISERAQWMGCAEVQKILLATGLELGRGDVENLLELEEAMEKIDPLNMKLIEKNVTHHDQLAVIEELGRYVSPGTKKLLHPGTTSYDILDTARSYLFKEAWENEMRPKAVEVVENLSGLGELYLEEELVQVGRTHLQNTSPVLFGGQLSNYAARVSNRIENADRVFSNLKGKVSGIVGTGAGIEMNFGGDGEEFERRALDKLGLKPDKTATQIVQKERLADVGNALVTLDGVLSDLAGDLRILYSSGIGEVTSRESAKRLGGSSTDPAKNNPINWENIAGKYSVVKSGMGILYDMIPTDLQRDLRSSVQARYQPQNMMSELYESLLRTSKSLKKLSVNTDKIEENLQPVRDFPTEAMLTILKGEGFIHPEYGLAHDFVKKMAQRSKSQHEAVVKTSMEDPYFREAYKTLPEKKEKILEGKLELYLGFAKERARENIEYAKSIL